MSTRHNMELRELSTHDLELRLQEAQASLMHVRFDLATRQMENTTRLREVKREIARIKTMLREREQEEA